MIGEKKFKLEMEKRDNIIKQLRVDRNKMIISYQKINADLIKIFDQIQSYLNENSDEKLKSLILNLKEENKKYFEN